MVAVKKLKPEQLFVALENLSDVFSQLHIGSFVLIPSILKAVQQLEEYIPMDEDIELNIDFIPFDNRMGNASLNCGLKIINLLLI